MRLFLSLNIVLHAGACLALSAVLHAPEAMAADSGQAFGWVRNFVRVHDGKEFCVPPGTQPQEFVAVISRYKDAHPELDGVIGGQDVLSAFTTAYPCAAPTATGDTAAAGQAAGAEPQPVDSDRVIQTLAATTGHENDQLVAEIERNPGNYSPPVLFNLTNLLYMQGRTDDAIFWLSAARLRANFDALRSADPTAGLEVGEMVKLIPLALRRAQFDDLAKLRSIVSRAVQWDKDTPYNYDPRWISPYRKNVADTGAPREQWPALADKTRTDYVASLDAAIRQIEARR